MLPEDPLPEKQQVALNYLASFILHISDAYLYMASYYYGDKEPPLFLTFFEDQVEVKKTQARFFIDYLKEHKADVCLSVIKRPEVAAWYTGSEALNYAQQLEQQLEELTKQLKSIISKDGSKILKRFVVKVVAIQSRNLNNLRKQSNYQSVIEKKNRVLTMKLRQAKEEEEQEQEEEIRIQRERQKMRQQRARTPARKRTPVKPVKS